MRSKFSIFNFQFSIKQGFGLIETLIASGIVAMLGVASVGLSNSIMNNNRLGYRKIIATNLSSEAIEVAHWIRDRNVSDNDPDTDWFFTRNTTINFDINSCKETAPCGIYPISRSQLSAAAQDFYFDTDPDTITLNNTNYVREIIASRIGNELNLTVRVKVNNTELAAVSSVLTNWK